MLLQLGHSQFTSLDCTLKARIAGHCKIISEVNVFCPITVIFKNDELKYLLFMSKNSHLLCQLPEGLSDLPGIYLGAWPMV